MHKDEKGYIAVEVIGTFIPLVLLIVSILSLVNIVTLQSRVHYAVTQAANMISVYSYTLAVTGVADTSMIIAEKANTVDKEADAIKQDINAVLQGLNTLSADEVTTHGEAVANRAYGWGESIVDDPTAAMQLIMNYGINEGRNAFFEQLLRPVIGRYLGNGEMSGDEYLKSVNVIDGLEGLDFYDFSLLDLNSTGENDSILIDKDGNVKIVVHYDIEYKFGALPLPFEPKLKVTQIVKTKAWLNGSTYEW